MNTAGVDIDALLTGLDEMASQRPVAAQIVATSNNDSTGATDLAAILGADVALAAKVMKLANSAYFGLSGKVTGLQFAVTVVGFNTVRAIATVSLSGIDHSDVLPEGFWEISIHLAAAAGSLGPAFHETTADAMCLGLLAQLGAALLHRNDVEGYDQLVATTDFGQERFIAEVCRYGISTPQLTAAALQQWHFPATMVGALRAVQAEPEGALLRTAYECTARLVQPGHQHVSLARVSQNRIPESQSAARLAAIRADVKALRAALGL